MNINNNDDSEITTLSDNNINTDNDSGDADAQAATLIDNDNNTNNINHVNVNDNDNDNIDWNEFAFHDLDYIPIGYSSSTAPLVESPVAVLRAVYTLFQFDTHRQHPNKKQNKEICILDLGCGEGVFLNHLLLYSRDQQQAAAQFNDKTSSIDIRGIGIDYNSSFIETAQQHARSVNVKATYIQYDFNSDRNNIAEELITAYHITNCYAYLVPKQLSLPTVRSLLLQLINADVLICCYKFYPAYLPLLQEDKRMELCLYGKAASASSCET
jgi:hypothetical protein